MKKNKLFIIALVLVISLVACNNQQTSDKLLSSEDLPYTRAIINLYGENGFDINIISWEFVNDDMIKIIGERKSEISDKVIGYNYDYLVHKSNVTFVTMERFEELINKE